MATLSMTVEVAGFQHGDGAIELSMYNVQCKILYLGFREFWGKYPPHVFLVSHFKYLGYLGFSV